MNAREALAISKKVVFDTNIDRFLCLILEAAKKGEKHIWVKTNEITDLEKQKLEAELYKVEHNGSMLDDTAISWRNA